MMSGNLRKGKTGGRQKKERKMAPKNMVKESRDRRDARRGEITFKWISNCHALVPVGQSTSAHVLFTVLW